MKVSKYILYLTVIIVSSCNSQSTSKILNDHNKSDAKALNSKALEISKGFNQCNKDSINQAINLLEQALILDSCCFTCYSNEANMFCRLKKYDKAVNVINKYLNICLNNISLETLKGFIFEKIGNIDSANVIYHKISNEYNANLKLDSSNINLKLNRAFIYLFTDGDKRGKDEYQKILTLYPEDKHVKMMKEIFYTFSRKII